jgi:hypothetical protein
MNSSLSLSLSLRKGRHPTAAGHCPTAEGRRCSRAAAHARPDLGAGKWCLLTIRPADPGRRPLRRSTAAGHRQPLDLQIPAADLLAAPPPQVAVDLSSCRSQPRRACRSADSGHPRLTWLFADGLRPPAGRQLRRWSSSGHGQDLDLATRLLFYFVFRNIIAFYFLFRVLIAFYFMSRYLLIKSLILNSDNIPNSISPRLVQRAPATKHTRISHLNLSRGSMYEGR